MSDHYLRSERVLWRRSHASVLVMSPGHEEVVSLQGPGTTLWELLARPTTISDVVRALAGIYGVAAETVAKDVIPVLDDLVARRLVRLQEGT
jgi:Coenzyme PQQ synthesis protein D (PqqD)